MIYIVSGYKRSGTTLMMHLLEKAGIPVVHEIPKNFDIPTEYGTYYECGLSTTGFTDLSARKIQGKAIKVFSYALNVLPKESEYRIIFMRRDKESVFKSLEKYAGKNMEGEIRAYYLGNRVLNAVKPKNMLIVDYGRLIEKPEEVLKEIGDFIGVKLDNPEIVNEIKPNLRHFK
jgi:hypothetical protein